MASSSSQNKYHLLLQRKELKRLHQLHATLEPEHYAMKQGALHKAILSVLQQELHQDEAIQVFIDCFIPLLRQRHFPDWIDLLYEIQKLADSRGIRQQIAELIRLRCRYLHDLNRIDELMSYASDQVLRSEVVADRLIHVDILILLAAAHKVRSEFVQAESYLQKGIAVLGVVDSPDKCDRYGRLLNIRGTIATSQTNWERGHALFREATDALKKSDNQFYYHRVLKNLAFSLSKQHRFDECFSIYETAITFFRENNYKYEECLSFIEFAIAYNARDMIDEAEKMLLSMDVDYLRQLPPTTALAYYYNNLGYYYFKQAMYGLSKPHLEAAIDTYVKLGESYRLSLASTYSQLGILHYDIGTEGEGDTVFRQALAILSEYTDAEDERVLGIYSEIEGKAPHLFA